MDPRNTHIQPVCIAQRGLVPDATGPAVLFFSRCTLLEKNDRLLVGSIPWTSDLRRRGVFHVGPGELKAISLARILHTPAMLKVVTFGTIRDGWLVEKLERTCATRETLLNDAEFIVRGQGFHLEGGDINVSPSRYYKLWFLTPDNSAPFRVVARNLEASRCD